MALRRRRRSSVGGLGGRGAGGDGRLILTAGPSVSLREARSVPLFMQVSHIAWRSEAEPHWYYSPGVVKGRGLADPPVAPYGQGDEYGQQAADPCRGGSQRCRGAIERERAGGVGGDGDGVDSRERLEPVREGGDGHEY